MNVNNYEKEITYDLPIEYKDLKIYPVKMEDYMLFQLCSNIILINKNKTQPNKAIDPKVISMSYLDYIFYLIETAETKEFMAYYFSTFYQLLKLCLKEDYIEYLTDENGKYMLKIKDVLYDRYDFDEIKKIIILQNMPDYDDSYIDPKVEEVLLEAEKFMNRNSKKMGSLEDQIICVLISTNLNMENIQNLTIRKFVKILQRVDYKLHYEIYKTASMSGMVDFKDGIDHWMTEIKHDRFAGLVMESNELDNKLKHVT